MDDRFVGFSGVLKGKVLPHVLHRRLARGESTLQLSVLDRGQDFFEARTRFIAYLDQVLASNQRLRTNRFGRQGTQLLSRVFIRVELAVAGKTVDAVQFQMLVEGGQAKELLQRGLIHALDVGEAHVIRYQRQNLIGLVVREAQTAADFGGHLYSYFNVTVEADAVGRHAEGGRLAYVVQQRSPSQGLRTSGGKFFQQKQRVHEDVAFGMELWRLLHSFHGGDFGQDFWQEAG